MTHAELFKKVVFVSKIEVKSRKVRVAEHEQDYFSRVLGSPDIIFNTFKKVFQESPQELFVVIHLKTNNEAIAFEIVTKGILNSSLVHPREVFRSAIIKNAAAIIIAHNHPSGSQEPSNEDLQITKQIKEAGKIVGIPVYDHIIFADDKYYSFAEHGMI